MKANMKMKRMYTLEWRERGRWVMSYGRFRSVAAAEERAKIIGARLGLIRVRPVREEGT